MAAVVGSDTSVPEDEFEDAAIYATRPVLGGGRQTRQSILMISDSGRLQFDVHDYVLDHDARSLRGLFPVPLNVPPAVWNSALATASNADDRMTVGIEAYKESIDDVAFEAFSPLAEAGNDRAKYYLKRMRLTAGDPQAGYRLWVLSSRTSYGEAPRRWLIGAADAGNHDAQNDLGMLMAAMFDVPESVDTPHWFEQAARMWRVGHCGGGTYYHDANVFSAAGDPPDLDEARLWFGVAAEAGHTGVQFHLGVLLASLRNPPESAEARRWYERAAQAGHIRAQANLGVLLATMLDPPELAEARHWLTAAAHTGHTNAQYNLGVLLGRVSRILARGSGRSGPCSIGMT
jgi:TPR repeat protein